MIPSPYQNTDTKTPAEKLLGIIANSVSKDQFKSTLEAVIQLISKQEENNMNAVKSVASGYQAVIKRMESEHTQTLQDLKGQVDTVFVREKIDKIIQEHESKMLAIDQKLATVKDGKNGDPKSIIKDVASLVKVPKAKNGSPDTAFQIRDKLETLKGDERLDKSAIKGWEDLEKRVNRGMNLAAGFKGFDLFSDGIDYGPTSYVDFVAGPNITITHTKVGTKDILTFASSGGGGGGGTTTVNVDTVSGTIDGLNKTFTVPNAITNPFLLVLGNSYYKYADDYTVSGTTITMTTAPDSSLSGSQFFFVHITGSTVYNDAVSGTINGVNKTFTVSNTILNPAALILGNSIYQYGVDFLTSGTTITMTNAPDALLSGSTFFLIHNLSITIYVNTMVGAIDSSNSTFTVANTISQALLMVLANSLYQSLVDFNCSGTTVTTTSPPDSSLSGQPIFLIHT